LSESCNIDSDKHVDAPQFSPEDSQYKKVSLISPNTTRVY